MNFQNLKLLFLNAVGWLMLHPIVSLILLAIILVGSVFGYLNNYCGNRKIEKIETNINQGKQNINALEGNANFQRNEVNKAEEFSNGAEVNKQKSDNKDSSEFNGNNAANRFCLKYPNDSTCRK